MPRLLHVGAHSASVYASGTQADWPAGTERDVSEEDAAYLLATFGGRFTLVEAPKPAAKPASSSSGSAAFPTDGPPRSSIVQASPRRRGTPRE